MSSYYTSAQLEAQRKAALRAQLEAQRKAMTERLRAQWDSRADVSEAAGFSTSALDSAVLTGSGGPLTLGAVNVRHEESRADSGDLSALLGEPGGESPELKIIRELAAGLGKRPILTAEDRSDRDRLMEFIRGVMGDKGLSDGERLALIEPRAAAYLRAGAVLTESEKARLREERLGYIALCEITGEEPRELTPAEIREETARLTAAAEKRAFDGYIMEVISDIMEELGCRAESEGVLDGAEGVLFSVTGHPLCEVFVGRDSSGIMFEPLRTAEARSGDKRREAARSANAVCGMYDKLEEMAAERGVILSRVYREEVEAGDMAESERVGKKRQRRKKREEKARAAPE